MLVTLLTFTNSSFAQEANSSPVRLQLAWSHQAQFAGVYVAQMRKHFEAEGLDVIVFPGGSALNPINELQIGNADVAIAWFNNAYQLSKPDKQVVNIGQIFSGSALNIVCRISAGVFSSKDMHGKKIGVWGVGDQDIVMEMLRKLSIPSNQVELIKQRPEMVRPRLNLASVFLQSGQAPLALTTLKEAVQLFPEFIPAKINLIRMALVGLNSGLDISDAKELLEREMELEVSHPQLMSTLVEWDIQTNGFERSSRLLDQLVVKFPNYIETYRLSAMVLAHGKQLPISVSKFFALVKTETTSQQIQAILTKMFLTDLLYVSRFKQEAHLFPFSFGREEGLDEMLQKHQEGLNATQTQLIQCFYRYSIGVTSHSKCPAVPQVLEDSRQLAKSKGLDTQAVETLQMLRQAVNRGQKDQIQKLLLIVLFVQIFSQ